MLTCHETMGGTVMVATNVFERGPDGQWMVCHQAGLCCEPPALTPRPPPGFDA